MEKYTEIYLVRHGETDYNIEKRYMGQLDIPLNDRGMLQAREAEKQLALENIDFIVSSDLQRCRLTAELINKNYKKEIVVDKDFREFKFGVFEGLTFQEAEKKYPIEAKKWIKNWKRHKITNGENMKEFSKRVLLGINAVLENPNYQEKKGVVVTHSGCIRLLLSFYYGKGIKSFWEMNIGNAKIVKLKFMGKKFISFEI